MRIVTTDQRELTRADRDKYATFMATGASQHHEISCLDLAVVFVAHPGVYDYPSSTFHEKYIRFLGWARNRHEALELISTDFTYRIVADLQTSIKHGKPQGIIGNWCHVMGGLSLADPEKLLNTLPKLPVSLEDIDSALVGIGTSGDAEYEPLTAEGAFKYFLERVEEDGILG